MAESLNQQRIKGRLDLPVPEDAVPPPTIAVDNRMRSAFPDQAKHIESFNEELRKWWQNFVVRKTKE